MECENAVRVSVHHHTPMHELPDPRVHAHPAAHHPAATALYALAEASLHAATGQEADVTDAAIAAGIAGLIARSDGAALAKCS